MDSAQLLSWAVGAVGLIGFHFSGKKVWWSWYINLGCQTLWFAYAIASSTPAFAATALFYTFVFGNNAIKWTKEERAKKAKNANISKNSRNRRRSPIHWRSAKRY